MTDTLAATLIVLGVVAVLGSIVGGGVTAAGFTVPVIPSVKRQVGLAVAGVAVLGLGLVMEPPDLFARGAAPTATPTPSTTPSSTPEPTATPAPAPAPVPVPAPTPTTAPPPAEPDQCVIDVTFPMASLNEEPSHRSRVLSQVPQGAYSPTSVDLVEWAGREEQWFQIEVDGRVGWILDDPIILTKSTACS